VTSGLPMTCISLPINPRRLEGARLWREVWNKGATGALRIILLIRPSYCDEAITPFAEHLPAVGFLGIGIGSLQIDPVGAELAIYGGDLRHRGTVAVGRDRRSWRYNCYI
jgi:hypothetical protein